MKKDLYLKEPLNTFLFEKYIDNAKFINGAFINEKEEKLFAFVSTDFKSKIDFSKGYKKIIINENDYFKKFIKYNRVFCYKEKKYLKAVKYFNLESTETLEVLNKMIDFKKDYSKYYFVSLVLDYNDNNLEYIKSNNLECAIWYELDLIEREFVNTKEEFNYKLEEIKTNNHKPKLLIHSCCGPCSSYCLELLNEYFDITILYYNPNIVPIEEYFKRLDEQRRIVECLGFNINIITKEYDHDEFFKAIKGINDNSEGGERCFACYKFRLEETCKLALENGFDYFTTTLSISPYKNSTKINEIGIELQNKYNCKFLYSNFKLNDGYKKSIELSKRYNLYRQDYCGCEYSLKFQKKKVLRIKS